MRMVTVMMLVMVMVSKCKIPNRGSGVEEVGESKDCDAEEGIGAPNLLSPVRLTLAPYQPGQLGIVINIMTSSG